METATPRTVSASAEEFDRHGYALIPDALTPGLRVSLRQAAEDLLNSSITRGRDRGTDGKDGFRGCLALHPAAFLPLVANPRVLPLIVDLLSPNIHILSSHLIALPSIPSGSPRSIRTPQRPGWHRDMFGVTEDLGSQHTPRMAIKCAYYLTDITPEAGLTMFLPGSHQQAHPNIPAGQIDPCGAVTPPISPAGLDAIVFENRTWHAGGINTSGHPRIAIMIQYGYRWLALVDDPSPELLDRTDLSDIQRQLLGATDRNPDGSLAKGRGAEPLRQWQARHEAETRRP